MDNGNRIGLSGGNIRAQKQNRTSASDRVAGA